MRRYALLLGCFVGLVAFIPLIGCEGSSTATLKAYDPCVLISLADVKEALGVEVKNTRHDMEPNVVGQSICVYEAAASNTTMPDIFVQIDVTAEAGMSKAVVEGGTTAASQYQAIKDNFTGEPGVTITTVPDVGDANWDGGCAHIGASGLHVLVKDKGVYFAILLRGTHKDCSFQQSVEKSLALKLIGGL